jgi:isoleucyl-tRNA synthetase
MLNLNDEERILKYWEENKINEKVRERNKGKKKFYFLDGPPFVSGDLHPAQIWVKVNKDAVVRYKRMRNFDVNDMSGYDVHGLPIENAVENKLKMGSKKDIEKMGVENFIKECKDFVNSYMGKMDSDYYRFGISLDFSKPYMPSENYYIEEGWALFKQLYDKGSVYEAKKTTPYCPHCEVVVSQGSFEVEYADDTDPSLYVVFKVDKKASKSKVELPDDSYLLIWTTTPWTLPANVSVMVNPKALYVVVKAGHRHLILAKDRIDPVADALGESFVVLREFYGSELDGLIYTSPFEDEIPLQKTYKKYHRPLFTEEYVSMSEGTGIVHCAPGHGLEDYTVGKENKVPIFSPVSAQAAYTKEAGTLEGLKLIDEANKKVLELLHTKDAILKSDAITHSYPHCWRCHSKVIQIATDQWFINIQKVKKKLVEENRKVVWQPREAQKWQEDVLSNSPDWCISRQRYWGIPMPLWRCKSCSDVMAIGSVKELADRAVKKLDVEKLDDLHRPYVDNISIKCKCGGEALRIKDICDVGFDSSIAFRASLSEAEFKRLFPVDFIAEAIEQLRWWFAYQLKIGVLLYRKSPFTHVFTHAMMLDEKGKKMSKSLGNFVSLPEILKQISADTFRLHCLAHVPQQDFPFSIEKAKEAERTLLLIGNIANLLGEYSDSIGYTPAKVKKPRTGALENEERWIVSRLNNTIKRATESFDNYEIHNPVAFLKDFITEDFSRFYLKLAKKKISNGTKGQAKKIIDVINYVMFNLVLMSAPIIPFTAEDLYQKYYDREDSVFFERWPKADPKLIDANLENEMGVVSESVTALLNSREKAGISLRQPLTRATLEIQDNDAITTLQKLSDIVEDSANVKKLDVKKGTGAKKEVRPLFAKLGPAFKDKAGAVAEALKSANADELQKAMETPGHYSLHTQKGTVDITKEHFTILETAGEGDAVNFKYGTAYVDEEITPELKEEALVREFERGVQMVRKELKLKKSDRISLGYEAIGDMVSIIKKNAKKIAKDLHSTKLSTKLDSSALVKDIQLEGETVKVSVKKLQ